MLSISVIMLSEFFTSASFPDYFNIEKHALNRLRKNINGLTNCTQQEEFFFSVLELFNIITE